MLTDHPECTQVCTQKVDQLFGIMDQLATVEPPLTPEEIQAEIEAARAPNAAMDRIRVVADTNLVSRLNAGAGQPLTRQRPARGLGVV
jgi:hypothetical protein